MGYESQSPPPKVKATIPEDDARRHGQVLQEMLGCLVSAWALPKGVQEQGKLPLQEHGGEQRMLRCGGQLQEGALDAEQVLCRVLAGVPVSPSGVLSLLGWL